MKSFSVSEFFKNNGSLAGLVPDYVIRESQVELAQAIEKTIQQRSVLLAEAGTGIGKTWAYLVPVYLSRSKVLVSTATRTLQDQLFRKDAPALKKALGLPVDIALLKGRNNYLCHFHFHRHDVADATFSNAEQARQFQEIKLFMQKTQTGDKADCSLVPEDSPIWSMVTSTRETCGLLQCPHYDECFLMIARERAKKADVVIVNHALLCADFAIKDKTPAASMLPNADVVIFDEAHQLPDIATNFFGCQLSTQEMLNEVKRTRVMVGMLAQSSNLGRLLDRLEFAIRDLILAADTEAYKGKKFTCDKLPQEEQTLAALSHVTEELESVCDGLSVLKEATIDFIPSWQFFNESLKHLLDWGRSWPLSPFADSASTSQEFVNQDAQDAQEWDDAALSGDPAPAPSEYVYWLSYLQKGLMFCVAPVSVSDFIRFKRFEQSWIFTSATLAVKRNFRSFQQQLGLSNAETVVLDSPFDYANQALLYVPDDLPEVNTPHFEKALVERLLPFIRKTTGGVLVLCTSLRAVVSISALLADRLDAEGIERLVLSQGERSRLELVERFRSETNAVLVGSSSFWEGMDFPGELLTLLVIDKLPFAAPDDPVLEARMKRCREEGGNPFRDIQVPMAAISLKQGAGRLIRTEKDYGMLIVGDARLVEKNYGSSLWGSLPAFCRTRNLQFALEFFDSTPEG